MFHYFKIPYFTCKVFTKFTYNEYIAPYFLSHVVLRFSPNDLPEDWLLFSVGHTLYNYQALDKDQIASIFWIDDSNSIESFRCLETRLQGPHIDHFEGHEKLSSMISFIYTEQ